MEHPDDSSPATLRAGELIGKFHGEKAATGPIGWRCTVCCKPGPGRDHAAIEAHACRRIPFDDVYEMVNRPLLAVVFIYSIAVFIYSKRYSYTPLRCAGFRPSSWR
jgi:hypothetical protein